MRSVLDDDAELVRCVTLEERVDHLAGVGLRILTHVQAADVREHESLAVRAFEADIGGRIALLLPVDPLGVVRKAGHAEPGIAALEREADPVPRLVERKPCRREDVRQTGDQQSDIELDLAVDLVDGRSMNHGERPREKYRDRR